MYSWSSDNKEIMMCEETDKVIVELFVSLLTKYQDVSENKMKGSDFVFECVNRTMVCLKRKLNNGGNIQIFLTGNKQKSNNKSTQ